ncbi:uncharacterized protein LOC125228365 isoform X3 [Leguminivora glycinivorella]|uniref:uncharacterized protein LOC125228365 isoform X3 n=1 Tax=Leguminivora glycinivorella TaxID=1035111 RepID=UPI00200D2C0C|nr:uncharacterized protein LOC125228365 isoform X3 [Leguminivora glycinivorella]
MFDKRRYAVVLTFVCVSALAAPPSQTKVYRTDYTYSKHTDAFYKLHSEMRSTYKAREICETEVDPEPYSPMSCEVVTRKGEIESTGCWRQAPFICKVDAASAPYDEHCGAYGKDYIPEKMVGSCYKIPKIVYSWNEALAECEAEGAHLVVLNSNAEHEVVKNIMNTALPVRGSKTSYFFFAGIRANHPTDGAPRVFRTITSTILFVILTTKPSKKPATSNGATTNPTTTATLNTAARCSRTTGSITTWTARTSMPSYARKKHRLFE